MWEQYRKTFVGVQVLIGVITLSVLAMSRLVIPPAVFFVTLQLSAVVGAMWGKRLRDKHARLPFFRA